MRRLQRDMNRLFEDWAPGLRGRSEGPLLNLWSGKDDLVVTVELPGVEAKDVDISVVGDQLTVRGKREAEAVGEDAAWVRQERPVGEFVRSIQLPYRVDADKVTAEMRNGVLRVTLPRHEADRPRQIVVKAS
jgi:HSP20 family protein